MSVMYIDVSYKATKKIRKILSQPIVSGLVTVMNECNEVHSQFFLSTDAHDQYITPFATMNETFRQYGQDGPRYVYTDNPSRDAAFFYEHMPSIKAEQNRLDSLQNVGVLNLESTIPACDNNEDGSTTCIHQNGGDKLFLNFNNHSFFKI